jgi:sulfate/thiosulfate transport system substrate-binding protein
MRALLASLLLCAACAKDAGTVTLLNVSFDPTRELYEDVNGAFAKSWLAKTGQTVVVNQSHAGSGKQARAVIDGLEADVVTLALAYDVEALRGKGKLIPEGWQARLPSNSAPFTSAIVLVVRKGNPKGIHDWRDLARPGVQVITPNPKTSGGARWGHLAAYGWALKHGDEASAREFMRALYANVPVLDAGARGASTTFAERGIGDVLVAWESEALLLSEDVARGKVEVVVPSASILAEPSVSVVDVYADLHGTRAAAEAYVQFLFTEQAQELAVKHHFRPRSEAVAARHAFAKLDLFTVDEVFGGWAQAQKAHFAEGGVFDEVTRAAH